MRNARFVEFLARFVQNGVPEGCVSYYYKDFLDSDSASRS